MSSTTDDMDLMAHFDGESHLESGDVDGEKIAALEEVRQSVRTYVEVKADALEPQFERMWTKIERRIEANGQTREAGDSAAAIPTVRSATAGELGMFARFKRWFGEHRAYVLTSAVTAAAVALLMFAIRPTEIKEGKPKIITVPKIVKVEKIVRVPMHGNRITVTGPADVDSLDMTEGTTGAVLRIPGEDGEDATTIIWLSPEEDPI